MANDSAQRAVYGCTALVGVNKKGILRPSDDGYYTLVIGALNAFNSSGAYYPLETGKALFEASGSLMRRIRTGCCKGEMGHPKPSPGMQQRDFIQRVLTIEETRVCCHYRKIWLEENGYRDASGKPIVAILGELTPSGPFGPALKASLDNPNENVCFSIRSLTQDHVSPAGYLQKDLKNIVTFDYVTEPGLSGSVKWNSPALEALQERMIMAEHIQPKSSDSEGVALESSEFTELRDLLGWSKPKPKRVMELSSLW
jgi:hypothetical protein